LIGRQRHGRQGRGRQGRGGQRHGRWQGLCVQWQRCGSQSAEKTGDGNGTGATMSLAAVRHGSTPDTTSVLSVNPA
jgi:hypothetical protein